MGFSPRDVDRMSVWQYMAALEGYIAAHSPEAANALSEDEKDDLWSWLEAKG